MNFIQNLKTYFENQKSVLIGNTKDLDSNYWAKFKGDATLNLDPEKLVDASEGTDHPPMMIPTKHNIIAYFVEDKLPQSVVLDIGCGYGRMNLFYKIKEYWGIDTTPEMIINAVELNKPINNFHAFSVFNGKKFPFTNSLFDYAFCSTVMLHLKIGTVKRYAEEVWRILKDNGEFIVNFPNNSNLPLIESIFSNFSMNVLDGNYCGTDTVYSFKKVTSKQKP